MLLPNNKYTLNVQIPDRPKQEFTFTTKLSPFFATIEQIKDDVTAFFEDVSNALIVNKIHENSVYALQIARIEIEDIEKPPFAIMQFVRAKTRHDILIRAALAMQKSDAERVQLADFSLDVDTDFWQLLKPVIAEYKEEVKRWQDAIMGIGLRGYAKPQVCSLSSETDSSPYGIAERWGDDLTGVTTNNA